MLKLNLPSKSAEMFVEGKLPRLVGVTVVEEEPEWTHPNHIHDDTSDIVFVTKGIGKLFAMGRNFKTQTGDLCIYNRGVLHGEASSYDDPVQFIALHLENVHIKGLREGCILPDGSLPIVKTGEMFLMMQSLFDIILRESIEQRENSDWICQYVVMTILSIIQRLSCDNVTNKIDIEDSDTSTLGERIMAFLDENYNQWITLDFLAEKFHYNRYYISHVFKQETGFSVSQYIINRRIGEAQRLLLQTNIPANEISNMVGYSNINQFYSVFKKHKGVSPIKFRLDNSKTLDG